MESDNNLVERYKKHDDFKAFEALYKENFTRVYAYVYRYIGNRQETEDVVSQTFETLLIALKKFDGKSKFSTFVIGIAKNKIRHYIQRKYRKPSDHIDYWEEISREPEESLETDELTENEKLINLIKITIESLNEKYREVIKLRYFEKLDTIETAERLGISAGNVRVLQNRAIKKLKHILNTQNENI